MSATSIIYQKNTLSTKIDELKPLIGHTPLLPIKNIVGHPNVSIYAKLEWQQFGGSVKARPAYQIIHDAIKSGALTPDKTLVDASSGNTAIAYAHIASRIGLDLTLCVPANASEERKMLLHALGAEIEYTSATGSTDEAQERAAEIAKADPGRYFYADQYNNESNWKAHFLTTSKEIIEQTDGSISHIITGLGTTGTFTGITRGLKEYDHSIKAIAVQPDIPMHGLEGWKHMGTAKVPGIYDPHLPDEHRTVSTEKAFAMVKRAAREEGLLLSPSAAANLQAAVELSRELSSGTIVTIFPDDASKYGEVLKELQL